MPVHLDADGLSLSFIPSLRTYSGYAKKEVIDDIPLSPSYSLNELCQAIRDTRAAQVLALRLPFNYNLQKLAERLLDVTTLPLPIRTMPAGADEGGGWPLVENDPSPFVYKFVYGNKSVMLIMCLPTISR